MLFCVWLCCQSLGSMFKLKRSCLSNDWNWCCGDQILFFSFQISEICLLFEIFWIYSTFTNGDGEFCRKRSFVEFASKIKSMWLCFPAGITPSAGIRSYQPAVSHYIPEFLTGMPGDEMLLRVMKRWVGSFSLECKIWAWKFRRIWRYIYLFDISLALNLLIQNGSSSSLNSPVLLCIFRFFSFEVTPPTLSMHARFVWFKTPTPQF